MSKWPLVRIRDVLTQVWREVAVDASKEYALLGAHWYAKGLYIKDIRHGSEIRANKLYRVQTGDFLYNRLFAWKGAFAVAEPDVDNCYVSNEFPCFEVDSEKVDGKYLLLYFNRESAWTEALNLSSGATPTSRNRLKEALFLKMTFPLPPIPEQRRTVALALKLADLKELQKGIEAEIHALMTAVLAKAFDG